MKKLNQKEIKDKLIAATIGGKQTKQLNSVDRSVVFKEYVQRAFPDAQILDVKPIDTTASLNSISGIIKIKFRDGKIQTVFGKIHIESNTKNINPLGAEQEYANAEMLLNAGWPAVKPLMKSDETDYPLLLYPVIKSPALFDILEKSHLTDKVLLQPETISMLKEYNKTIGAKETEIIRVGTRQEAIDAPVQTLFLKRFEKSGRIDEWYESNTKFAFPGLNKKIIWNELLDKKWKINEQDYDFTLRQIVDQARKSLSFEGETKTFLTISHGDDHAGNIRLTNPPTVFDPAFAGWNPAALDLKALAHTGFLPMAAMYYLPKGLQCNYKITEQKISVTINMQNLPMYKTQEILAKQIIDTRIISILQVIKEKGGDIEKEKQRVKAGLVGCALLTVNIAKLLEENDGRAVGLLPMAIMFSQLKGLSMLKYLDEEINKLRI